MAFSGSGSGTTRAHTHDSTIVNDGGSLNLDNITQGGAAMTTGAVTYSDGAAGHMQALTLGLAGQSLVVNAGTTAPEWGSPAANVQTVSTLLPANFSTISATRKRRTTRRGDLTLKRRKAFPRKRKRSTKKKSGWNW